MDVGLSSMATPAGGMPEQPRKSQNPRAEAANKILNATKSVGVTKSDSYGSVIGEPKLSDKAAKYYEGLKEKFGDAEFVLVANDSIEGAEKKAASMNAAGKTVVLIDAEKIERMANDEKYAKQIEGTIATGKDQLAEMAKQLSGMKSVSGFGMRINDDGKASFFAISAKNNTDVARKMADKRAAKKAEDKKNAKAAEKRRAEEKLKENRAAKDDKKVKDGNRFDPKGRRINDEDDYDLIEADSIEELMDKLSKIEYDFRSDNVMTPDEQALGGSIDFSA